MTIQYGYGGVYKPKQPRVQTSPLALAAAGKTSAANPFGFQTSKNTTGYHDPISPMTAAAPPRQQTTTPPVQHPLTSPTSAQAQQPTTPPVPGGYDINTDVALQQANALTGLNDEQATAAALKQKQHLALDYGDQGFARSLGLDDSYAQAAAGNPSSQLAQAAQQHDRNGTNLTNQLFENNLGYSGYRVTQEQQAAQDYQNLLAGLAGSANSNADTIGGNLAAALAGNQQTRISAEQAARDRAVAAALATGGAGGTDGTDSIDGIPITIHGPGPVAPQPGIGGPPSSLPPLTGQGAVIPMGNLSLGLGSAGNAGSEIAQLSQMLGSGSGDLSAAFAPPAPPKKKHSYAGRAL